MSEKLHLMQYFGSKINTPYEMRVVQRAEVLTRDEAIILAKRIGGTFYIEDGEHPATESGFQHTIDIENLAREWKNDDRKELD